MNAKRKERQVEALRRQKLLGTVWTLTAGEIVELAHPAFVGFDPGVTTIVLNALNVIDEAWAIIPLNVRFGP